MRGQPPKLRPVKHSEAPQLMTQTGNNRPPGCYVKSRDQAQVTPDACVREDRGHPAEVRRSEAIGGYGASEVALWGLSVGQVDRYDIRAS
jgi:hypothetical protein